MQPSIEEIRERLTRAFHADATKGMHRVYQFHTGDDARFHLEISDGNLLVSPGSHAKPSVTMLFPDAETALALLEGRLDPMQAFLNGQIRSDGNLILALQLGGLFWR